MRDKQYKKDASNRTGRANLISKYSNILVNCNLKKTGK